MGTAEKLDLIAQFTAAYKPVSRAASMLSANGDRWDAARVYRALQRGELQGLVDAGRWFVETDSINRLIARRSAASAESEAPPPAA